MSGWAVQLHDIRDYSSPICLSLEDDTTGRLGHQAKVNLCLFLFAGFRIKEVLPEVTEES